VDASRKSPTAERFALRHMSTTLSSSSDPLHEEEHENEPESQGLTAHNRQRDNEGLGRNQKRSFCASALKLLGRKSPKEPGKGCKVLEIRSQPVTFDSYKNLVDRSVVREHFAWNARTIDVSFSLCIFDSI